MKYLLIFVLLIGACTKETSCPVVDGVTAGISDILSNAFKCDATLVRKDLIALGRKLPMCSKGTQFSSANGDVLCSVVPGLVKLAGDLSTAKWKCETTGDSLESMLKAALKCQ